jgi:hypothetical protein
VAARQFRYPAKNYSAFTRCLSALAVDLKKATVHSGELRPMEASGWGPRSNIDGVISVASAEPGTNSTGSVQLFRDVIVEVVFSDVFFDPPPDMKTAVAGVGAGLARELAGLVEPTSTPFSHPRVPPAVSFFISLHRMKGAMFHVSQRLASYGRYAFDRDTILLPEITMDDYDAPVPAVLKPALDKLWQAAGLERCFDCADDGRWAPRR